MISTSFGCPYEGEVAPERVLEIAAALAAAGASEVGFGDTTGMANPIQVREFFERAAAELPGVELTAHFHNTRGQGLANVLAALEAGCASFESSFGELGGCPVPAGATGNIASEDLVSMLRGDGDRDRGRPGGAAGGLGARRSASSAARSARTRSSPARSSGSAEGAGAAVFSRVLIANRGEIAVRIARTLRRLGIESVAVYSDADADAVHVRAADQALRIGPALAAESYLSVERVIEAAVASGAEAIHPGYGFLSERPELPLACAEAGIVFVGPGPEAMALLGDKVEAKAVAEAAGVPVLPGLAGESLSDEEIASWVEGAELPVLLKAAAGGGGRGMRVVRERGELAEALAAARREAAAAFGDDRLLVERYLEGSRHIEVQLIADAHGNCDPPRRARVQPAAPPPEGDRGGALAGGRRRRCASGWAPRRWRWRAAAGYVNAGTVELIADRDDPESFFFLEMNARLQVEHPVTEAVTGLDLVELQLRVAAGEELPLAQEDVGCAAGRSRRGSTPRNRGAASCPRPGPSSPTASPELFLMSAIPT